MGNTTLLAPAAPLDGSTRYVVIAQSSNPEVLSAAGQAFVDDLIAGDVEGVVDMLIEGAGDGHTFVLVALVTGGTAPATGTLLRVFMGANRVALQAAADAVLAEFQEVGGLQVILHGVGGADQGTRFCGVMVAQPIPV